MKSASGKQTSQQKVWVAAPPLTLAENQAMMAKRNFSWTELDQAKYELRRKSIDESLKIRLAENY